MAAEARGDPGRDPPAGQPGVTLTYARRRSWPAALYRVDGHCDPVLRPPAVQLGVTLSAAVPKSCVAACVLPVPSPLARSLQLQQVEKKTGNLAPPRRRRRRPKLLRVTLSPVAGQQDQRPPASRRDSTLHQRPGTNFLRPQNGCGGPCLTTVACRSSLMEPVGQPPVGLARLGGTRPGAFCNSLPFLSTPVTVRPPMDWLDGR